MAAEGGGPCPIHPSYEATSQSYDHNVQRALSAPDSTVLVASHNNSSVLRALAGRHPRLLFAQLKGINDSLTHQLAAEDQQVFKYIPYGESDIMVPFLIRRAEEVSQNRNPN